MNQQSSLHSKRGRRGVSGPAAESRVGLWLASGFGPSHDEVGSHGLTGVFQPRKAMRCRRRSLA